MRRIPRQDEIMSEIVRERVELIQSGNLRFIIDPRGVTKFVVKEMGSKERFTVSIGERHMCTCKEKDDLCIHILYILIKYFGIPVDNPMLIKQPLSEHDVNLIIDGKVRAAAPRKPQPTYKTKSGKTKVKRLPITEEDVCPICYDSLCDCDKSKIAWCRCGCGGNFHRKCVKEWIDSRRMYGEEPTCPICRTKLDMLGINAPPKKKPPPSNAPPNLTPEEIRDLMTRDLSPDDYDLLLRLDQPRVMPQPSRPRPTNTRTHAAAQILGNTRAASIPQTPPDLTLNGAAPFVEIRNTASAQNLGRPQQPQRQIGHPIGVVQHFHPIHPTENDFNAEILGRNPSSALMEQAPESTIAPVGSQDSFFNPYAAHPMHSPHARRMVPKKLARPNQRRNEQHNDPFFAGQINGQSIITDDSDAMFDLGRPLSDRPLPKKPVRPRIMKDMPRSKPKAPRSDLDGLCVTAFKT